jgi:hypothetical protein
MNKKILLIGNTNGLPGVKIDIANYTRFFKSLYGGNWLDTEIEPKLNPSKLELELVLSQYRSQSLDFAIVVFSGHGGQERETVLEINDKGDTVSESSLKNLANRQITIFDCCRAFPQVTVENKLNERMLKAFSAQVNTRAKYEKRIMEAIPQQISLYACAIGECANDTSSGGAYSKHLISRAYDLNTEFKLVGNTHEEAAVLTRREFPSQNPDAILPRCFSSQQLIFSINPDYSTRLFS